MVVVEASDGQFTRETDVRTSQTREWKGREDGLSSEGVMWQAQLRCHAMVLETSKHVER